MARACLSAGITFQ